MSASGRSFYPGHDDGEKRHSPNAPPGDPGVVCSRCGMNLFGRTSLLLADDPPPTGSLAALQAKARALSNMQGNAMANKQLTNAELIKELNRIAGSGQIQAQVAQGRSQTFGQLKQQPLDEMQQMQQMQQSMQQMQQSIAQRMGGLSEQQIKAACEVEQKALAIALFHTDPRIHSHLLLDPANDDPASMDAALVKAWRDDLFKWKTQATERAAKMVAIMDGLGKASL